ncbi:alkaline phosphatase family protein [candidate division KSB1 bacterium]|nr:alkaline phosphatase family protein [candidate division KSB1 bacterium]
MRRNILIVSIILILATGLLASEQPYVILISFDGFRWDYPQRSITPNLDTLAIQGVSALSLQPVFPSKTFPNHYSIISGLYPEHHGIIQNDFVDPVTQKHYKVGNQDAVRNSWWYRGEAFWETAERQGVTCASYFWPGSEVDLPYRRSTYVEYYEHDRPYEKRVEGVLEWLQLPEMKRPHFITLYFDATDTEGHRHGPNSPETDAAIRRLDDTLGLLCTGLKRLNLYQQTNIIVVSDHGMAEVANDHIIRMDTILKGKKYETSGLGAFMMIDCSPETRDDIYRTLKDNALHYDVYLREEVPEAYHFSNSHLILPIVIMPHIGWAAVTNTIQPYIYKYHTHGDHGYDNFHMDMHGIFYACGPAFRNAYKTGTLQNIDIYPLLCDIFNIFPHEPIDGNLERIEQILKVK